MAAEENRVSARNAARDRFVLACLIGLLCLGYTWAARPHLAKYVVVVDPGHGGRNIGAVTRNGLTEKDLTLRVGLRLKQLLAERSDVQVVMTRTDDRALGLWDRRDLSNHNRADVFVSIHFNGSRDKTVNRTEVFYSSRVSRRPAGKFRDMVVPVVRSDSGLVQRVHWTVLWKNRAHLGAVLVEAMYLSHPTADRFLADTTNLDAIALSLSRTVDTVLDSETERRASRGHGVLASLLGMLVR
ncbi:MAG: N-acetylmuramoyl-L-alanine amidase [Gemmatimonadales bacterium]